jgi:hypothetical protein
VREEQQGLRVSYHRYLSRHCNPNQPSSLTRRLPAPAHLSVVGRLRSACLPAAAQRSSCLTTTTWRTPPSPPSSGGKPRSPRPSPQHSLTGANAHQAPLSRSPSQPFQHSASQRIRLSFPAVLPRTPTTTRCRTHPRHISMFITDASVAPRTRRVSITPPVAHGMATVAITSIAWPR